MKCLTRRDFLKHSAAAGLVLAIQGCAQKKLPFSRIKGANEDIRIAVVGCRGKGSQLTDIFHNLPGVRVVALCDVDSQVLADNTRKFTDRSEKIDTYIDVRKLIDRSDIDAVVVATPNHWHSLITIWACQAGKDVYVEKPVSHNIWEGRRMVEAARKYNRIVQAGTHLRSDEGLRESIDYVQQGNLGKILRARGFCYKRRDSIGKVTGPQPVPESVDYNLWTGPAPLVPLMRKNLHYDWHWVWPTGNGDLGNQGAHEMDLCRWALGRNALPPRVISIGGRFGYIDDGQTPNTQIVFLDYQPAPIIFEVRGLPRKTGDPAMDNYSGIRIGVVVQCENGYLAGGWAYDNNGNKIKQFTLDGGGGHPANFIKALRSRKVTDLNADVLEGHLSSALCHMGNISHRVGTDAHPEQIKEQIRTDSELSDAFERFTEHLAANNVDLSKIPAVLGPWLKMDLAKEKFSDSLVSRQANQLLTRKYRWPFIVPHRV